MTNARQHIQSHEVLINVHRRKLHKKLVVKPERVEGFLTICNCIEDGCIHFRNSRVSMRAFSAHRLSSQDKSDKDTLTKERDVKRNQPKFLSKSDASANRNRQQWKFYEVSEEQGLTKEQNYENIDNLLEGPYCPKTQQ
eukprot:3976456-Amphidinium_carterae.1